MIELDVAMLADVLALLAITRGRSAREMVLSTILGATAGAWLGFFIAKEESDSTLVRVGALALGAVVGGIFGLVFGFRRRYPFFL